MSDIKLFRTNNGSVQELKGTSVAVERSLQTLIEQHLEEVLGIRFLESEHRTGKVHGGRIDTLGVDENGCPVIIEYKRAINENVINQGLFYLDWLMDHQADFKWLVMDRLGKEQADSINWSTPRLICVAGDFTNYDEHAVKQIPRNIDLIRYRRYGEEFLLLELAHTSTTQAIQHSPQKSSSGASQPSATSIPTQYEIPFVNQEINDLFEMLKAFLLALGDDVQMKVNQQYIGFKRIKNFVSVALRKDYLIVRCAADLDNFPPESRFSKIVNDGKTIEMRIKNPVDLERMQPLFVRNYEAS